MAKTRAAFAAAAVLLIAAILAAGQRQRDWTDKAQLDFLKKHWQTPVPSQGQPPANFSELESSLNPESCGTCHPSQFEDWKTTIHSRSVGPGLLGQTPSFLLDDPDTAAMCYTCHAPLSEQQEILGTGSVTRKNPRYDVSLQKRGVTCAGCHVRNHQRFGPPKPDGSLEGDIATDQAPHGGATRTPAFERAEFCMGCHQFGEDERSLNGKLLENTYNEWKGSPYAARGVACQQCHMPERRHLWRGVHDPEMVKRGVTFELRTSKPTYDVGDKLEAKLIITNSGVGHYFPSYITPKVTLQLELLDANDRVITGSGRKESIGREATLDLSREVYDTRIPPKGTHEFRYSRTIAHRGLTLRALVTVYPDDFYRRFYEAKLSSRLSEQERKLLGEALNASRQSAYKLFEKKVPL